jgi:hypothetical protein
MRNHLLSLENGVEIESTSRAIGIHYLLVPESYYVLHEAE